MIAFLLAVSLAPQQEKNPLAELVKFLSDANGVSGGDETKKVPEIVKESLENPSVFNVVLNRLLKGDSGWTFLRDLEVDLKVFDTDDGEGSLGLSWSYAKSIPFKDLSDASTRRGLAASFKSRGNVAFEEGVNPRDFLEADLSLRLFQSAGGVSRTEATDQDKAELFKLEEKLVDIKDRAELKRSEAWTRFLAVAQNRLSTQLYVDFAFRAGIESDQAFTTEQYVFGAHAVFEVKAWNAHSFEAWLNLFDYPCALVRYLSGYDEEFRVRGSTIPTVLVGVDRVNPKDDDPRTLGGDDSSYNRWTLEVSFRSPVLRYQDATVYFNANWRYFREMSPSDAIEQAHLHRNELWSLSLTSSKGLYVSYSAGSLPFDRGEEVVYELGWKFGS